MTISIGQKVSLTGIEKTVASLVARKRNLFARQNVVNCRRSRLMDDFAVNLNGYGAELAFCRLAGVYPDLDVHIRTAASGQDQGDCVLPDGRKVDVKTTEYTHGRLLAVVWKQNTSIDLYALMVGKFPHYEFRGVISAAELCQPHRILDLGYGKNYVGEQSDLRDLRWEFSPIEYL